MESDDFVINQIWERLIDTITNSIEKQSDLEEIIKILISLTYDDLGLFCSNFTNGSAMEEAFNKWLLNQMMYILNFCNLESVLECNVRLQIEMLSAGYLKRPDFYIKTINEYVSAINKLIPLTIKEDRISQPFELEFFFEDPQLLKSLYADIKYQKVIIKHERDLNKNIDFLLMFLTHAVNIGFQCHPNIFIDRVIDVVLQIFSKFTLQTKTSCLTFFNKMFDKAYEPDLKMYQLLSTVLNSCDEILKNCPTWRHFKCVDNDHLGMFLDTISQLYENEIWKKLSNASIHISSEIEFVSIRILKHLLEIEIPEIDTRSSVRSIVTYICDMYEKTHRQVLPDSTIERFCKYLHSHTSLENLFAVHILQSYEEDNNVNICEKKYWNELGDTWLKSNLDDKSLKEIKSMMQIITITQDLYIRRQQAKLPEVRSLILLHDKICLFDRDKIEFKQIIPKIINSIQFETKPEFIEQYKCALQIYGIILGTDLSPELNASMQKDMVNHILFYLQKFLNMPTSRLFSLDVSVAIAAENSLHEIILCALSNLSTESLKPVIFDYLKKNVSDIMQQIFRNRNLLDVQNMWITYMPKLLFNEVVTTDMLSGHLLKSIFDLGLHVRLFECVSLCIWFEEAYMLKYCDKKNQIQFICLKCENTSLNNIVKTKGGILKRVTSSEAGRCSILNWIQSGNADRFSSDFIANHLAQKYIEDNLESLFKYFPRLVRNMLSKSYTIEENLEFLTKLGKVVLRKMKESINQKDRELQLEVIEILEEMAHPEIPEKMLFNYFKILFFYMVLPDMHVVHRAHDCALVMCARRGITTNNLLNWYRQDVIQIIVMLIVNIERKDNMTMVQILKEISYMFGFSCTNEFICKNYKFMVAMILPYCIEQPECKTILSDISAIIKKNFNVLLTASFLTTYIHIALNEEPDIRNACIEFITEHTKLSLYQLLHLDIKKTSEEILVYFNRNPSFVLNTFRRILSDDHSAPSTSTGSGADGVKSKDIIQYISKRFLGILTYFETNLLNPDVEKSLKTERLRSLGAIIRFVGNVYITPIRYKVIALLTTITTFNDESFKEICIDIWKIFLHNVDIKSLGESLGRIVSSLELLIDTNKEDVNAIYKFLIISNGNLLSSYIPDLYFIENLDVDNEIKDYVARQTKMAWKGKNFIENFNFFQVQIIHENLFVRIYGLQYLTKFISQNRDNVNKLIADHNDDKKILENVLENLMVCCKHVDRNLKLSMGKCLGELGAIEPSHLFAHFPQKQNDFSFGVQMDSFAIMALKELCRAFQFPEDTKYVDNFSLAIQEILQKRGVCPKEKKKMEVWESIPESMRQIMEPLLTSTYCSQSKISTNFEHPIFNLSHICTYEDWAFRWSSKMVEMVNDEDTQPLLRSFQPSMKRDRNILGLFLPYVVLHALHTLTEEDASVIYEELKCVFEFAVCHNAVKMKFDGPKVVNTCDSVMKKNDVAVADTLSPEDIGIKCAKVGFDIIDYLERWLREWKAMYEGCTPSKEVQRIDHFVKRFDKNLMAKANFNCNEYARALMYIENYIAKDAASRLQPNLPFLMQIYADLMDPDSLEGAVHMKKDNLTLAEQILYNSITDRLEETTICYEQVMTQSGGLSQKDVDELIQCYLRLDTPETALLITEGLWRKLSNRFTDEYFKECQAEPLWKLGRFEDLEQLLEDPVIGQSSNWGVQCGQVLLMLKKPDISTDKFCEKTDEIRLSVLRQLKTVSAELDSYHKGYSQVIKLHLLSEIEKTKLLLDELQITQNSNESKSLNLLQEFLKDWNLRLHILQPTVRSTEPVLCLRRILLKEMQNKLQSGKLKDLIDTEIGKLWLRSIKIHRKAGWFQQAHLSIIKAENYSPQNLFAEKAKLYWQKGDQMNAFKIIREKIQEFELKSPLSPTDRQLYAQAKYLQATYNAESMNICSELNIQYFKESLEANKKSEKCLVYFAEYLDKMYSSMSDEQQNTSQGREILYEVMQNYAKSMYYGCEFIYQSMPRLLSIWFDFTSQNRKDDGHLNMIRRMCDMVNKCSTTLPPFIFFSAFSQLVSRICHPSMEVYQVLKSIIIRLIQTYPQQSLWMILPVMKSSYPNRAKRCIEIYDDQRLATSQMQVLIKDFNTLAELLIDLTNKEIPKTAKTCTVSSLVPRLPKLFKNTNFSKILLPFEKFMQITLPQLGERNTPANAHDAFPYKQIYISGIREEITVLVSLQRPRKVVLVGSNGVEYTFMMKPKDDLRKDFRLMEFNALVKQYLFKDPQARQRRLKIRTYAVLPLNEECGIIEWVQNLDTFRNIIKNFHRARKAGMTNRELKAVECKWNEPAEKKREVFLKRLLPRHPPVFYEWFIYRFTTPHNWYQARSSYIKTTAVMSVVGYILGLGDRHGENIMFDVVCGDAVHVDFNCLFNLGETYQYAEKVPFRLTHNMVHAMGPMEVEGLYRKCCEITMRVLKEQRQILMSVLRPFVYDPLVTWNRSSHSTQQTERTDPKAMANVRRIEERLRGYVKINGKTSSMPLSTEGQVSFIISEATDIDNLAAMFIGWGSYL